jgi:hypothetical protein
VTKSFAKKSLEEFKKVDTNFVFMESLGMRVYCRRFPHTIEVLNGFINNKLPWNLGGD